MAGCRVVCVPTDERYPVVDRRDRARHQQPDARDRDDLAATTPAARSTRGGACVASTSCAAIEGCTTSPTNRTSIFTYGAARHVSPGSFADAEGHTISLYSLSKAYGFAGWRIGYMGYPDAADLGDDRRARTRS